MVIDQRKMGEIQIEKHARKQKVWREKKEENSATEETAIQAMARKRGNLEEQELKRSEKKRSILTRGEGELMRERPTFYLGQAINRGRLDTIRNQGNCSRL